MPVEHTVEVERGRLRFFAAATGQADPVYTEVEAARRAGHPDLPVPPTFLFCLDMERPDPWGYLRELGIELMSVLHGEQAFAYHAMAHAGDRLTFSSRIADEYRKKNLRFLVRATEVTREGTPVAQLTATLVIR